MNKIIFYGLVFLLSAHQTFALSFKSGLPIKMKILDISESGRVLKVDRGYFDGIRFMDSGDFYLFFEDSGIIGRGEAVKVFGAVSYWHIIKNILGGLENKGDQVFYFPEQRREMGLSHHSREFSKEQVEEVEYYYLDL